MLIRIGEPSDARSVAQIQVSGWHEAYKGFMPSEHLAKMTVETREAIWQKLLAEGVTLVAENDSELAGFCSIGPVRDDDSDAAVVGEIYALYVEPRLWRAGVGSALTTSALRWLKSNGFTTASLWVLAQNAIARRFYQKFGFTPDGKTKVYRTGSGELQELCYTIVL